MSKREQANAKPLSTPGLAWFGRYALVGMEQAKDPRFDLVSANLAGLPTTTIINAELDPLRSEGEQLAGKLRQAGVRVTQRTYPGVAHEFFGQDAAVADAKTAQNLAGSELKRALASR